MVREQGTLNWEQGTLNWEQGTLNWEQGTGKTELIPTESCMATPRKLSKIKYYSYIINININILRARCPHHRKLLGIVFYWQVPNYENPQIL